MNEIRNFLSGLLAATARVLLWVVMAVLALFLLTLALVFLLLGVLWALLRGRKPVPPVFVGRFRQFTAERVWPGAAGGDRARSEVVDVEVREVRDAPVPPADTGSAAAPGDDAGRLDGPPR